MRGTKLTAEQKVARLREAYSFLDAGQFEQAANAFSENAAWHGFIAGDIRGRQAIKGAFEKMYGLHTSWHLHDVLANDEHVVALHEIKLSKDGKTAETRQVMVAHLDDEGKIAELWTMGNPQDLAPFLPARK